VFSNAAEGVTVLRFQGEVVELSKPTR